MTTTLQSTRSTLVTFHHRLRNHHSLTTPNFSFLFPSHHRNSKSKIRISIPTSHHRHHSSNTPLATRADPENPRLNPPSSTLPPPLVLPVRSPTQSLPAHLFRTGKAYLAFYKTGLKAVYTNYRSSQAVVARLARGGTPTGITSSGSNSGSTTTRLDIPDSLLKGHLTRGEWQLIRRSRYDVARIPLFALVFMICGEFTPLVVVFLSGVVPRTCWVPRQVEGARVAGEERRRGSFRMGMALDSRGGDGKNNGHGHDEGMGVGVSGEVDRTMNTLNTHQIIHIGRSLNLYSKWWDRILGNATGFQVPLLEPLIKKRVQRRLEYLTLDDFAIERDGGVDGLEIEEVRISSEERGLDVLGRNDRLLRDALRAWLRARGRGGRNLKRLLLTRPNVWDKR